MPFRSVLFILTSKDSLKVNIPGGKKCLFDTFCAIHLFQVKIAWNNCLLYSDGTIANKTAQEWLVKFENGIRDLENVPLWPTIRVLRWALDRISKGRWPTTAWELAEKMDCGYTTLINDIKSLGCTQKFGAYVYVFSRFNKESRYRASWPALAQLLMRSAVCMSLDGKMGKVINNDET